MKNKIFKHFIKMYKITYQNGFIQYKQLVTQQYYETEYIPLKTVIGMHEELKPNKSKEDELKKWKMRMNILNNKMKELFPYAFFTTNSPLGKAINTGVLILSRNTGDYFTTTVKVEKL